MADAWKNVGGFPGTFVDLTAILNALTDAQPVLDALTAAEKVRTDLMAAALLIQEAGSATTVLLASLEALLSDLLSTDLYALPTGPVSLEALLSGFPLVSVESQIRDALDDRQDPNRPVFSGDAVTAAVVVLAGAQTLVALKPWIEAWADLYSRSVGGAWRVLLDRMKAFGEFELPPKSERAAGGGAPPDWYKGAANLLDAAGTGVTDAVQHVRTAALAYGASGKFGGLTAAVTDVVSRHASLVGTVIGLIEQVRATVDALKALGQQPGLNLYTLILAPEVGGTAGFVRRLESAGSRPADQYMAGMVFMVGAPTLSGVSAAWDGLTVMLGLSS